MSDFNSKDKIYIVISQTGTALSRILRRITGSEYNHVSLSLSPDLQTMYSFGRKFAYNPFWGGFVVESPNWGTFKRFSNTKIIVLELDIESEKYENIVRLIDTMKLNKNSFGYNYIGLIMAYFNICKTFNNRFYCSEFLKHILQEFSVYGADRLEPIVQPMHFLDIPFTHKIYTGKLNDYESFYSTFENTVVHI